MSFIGSLFGLTLKMLGVALAINMVILVLKGGKQTMRDLRDTLLMAIKLGIARMQGWLTAKYMEHDNEKGGKQNEADPGISETRGV